MEEQFQQFLNQQQSAGAAPAFNHNAFSRRPPSYIQRPPVIGRCASLIFVHQMVDCRVALFRCCGHRVLGIQTIFL